MHGDDDQIVPIAVSALKTAKIVQDATLKVYPGFPHGMPVTHKDEINADLLAFVEGKEIAAATSSLTKQEEQGEIKCRKNQHSKVSEAATSQLDRGSPRGAARGIAILVHGFNAHSGYMNGPPSNSRRMVLLHTRLTTRAEANRRASVFLSRNFRTGWTT